MKPVIVGLACLLSCIITHASTLTHAQQIAKENGITLYNQYKTAEPELRIAAEAGDRAMSSTLEIIHKYHIISAQISAWEKPF